VPSNACDRQTPNGMPVVSHTLDKVYHVIQAVATSVRRNLGPRSTDLCRDPALAEQLGAYWPALLGTYHKGWINKSRKFDERMFLMYNR
jgi:hypothetical protein